MCCVCRSGFKVMIHFSIFLPKDILSIYTIKLNAKKHRNNMMVISAKRRKQKPELTEEEEPLQKEEGKKHKETSNIVPMETIEEYKKAQPSDVRCVIYDRNMG
eukprot:382344_1